MSDIFGNPLQTSLLTASSALIQVQQRTTVARENDSVSVNNSPLTASCPVRNNEQYTNQVPNAIQKDIFLQSLQSKPNMYSNIQTSPTQPSVMGQNLIQYYGPNNSLNYLNCQQSYMPPLPLLQIVAPPPPQMYPNVNGLSPSRLPVMNSLNKSVGSPQYLNNVMQHPLLGYRNMAPTTPGTPTSPYQLQNTSKTQQKWPAAQNKNTKFESYISIEEVEEGLKTGKFFKGVFRTNPKYPSNSYVTINQSDQDILIEGFKNRNRALEGDIVIITLIDDAEIEANKKNLKKRNQKQAGNKTKSLVETPSNQKSQNSKVSKNTTPKKKNRMHTEQAIQKISSDKNIDLSNNDKTDVDDLEENVREQLKITEDTKNSIKQDFEKMCKQSVELTSNNDEYEKENSSESNISVMNNTVKNIECAEKEKIKENNKKNKKRNKNKLKNFLDYQFDEKFSQADKNFDTQSKSTEVNEKNEQIQNLMVDLTKHLGSNEHTQQLEISRPSNKSVEENNSLKNIEGKCDVDITLKNIEHKNDDDTKNNLKESNVTISDIECVQNVQENKENHKKRNKYNLQISIDQKQIKEPIPQSDKDFYTHSKFEEVNTELQINGEDSILINSKYIKKSNFEIPKDLDKLSETEVINDKNEVNEEQSIVDLTENGSSDECIDKKLKQGKVVYILEIVHPRVCVGFLKLMPDKNKTMASFQPRDARVPLINIPATYWPDNFYKRNEEYANKLFVAKIIDWSDPRFATGIIVAMIGECGDLKTEQQAILAQNDLDVTPFHPSLKIYYPSLDYQIPLQEIKLREDCRKLCLFAIDPYNCRDVDDTVSCRELDNGNYEIGVHISDVSYYLVENTPLDEKVSKKATTIYMVEQAFHMLPDDLCLLCSLFPGKDKLAFSVFWEITKDAKILNHRISKTIIQSCAQLSYENAQDILEGKNIEDDFPTLYNGFTYNDICKTIKILGSISAILRENRFDRGALKIDQLKINIKLNPDGLPGGYVICESKESNQLIEEFMLLANCTVAKRLYEDYPKLAFLRCHEPPNSQMIRDLDEIFRGLGVEFDLSTPRDIYRSLLKCTENKDVATAEIFNRLCAKPMARAKYFCAASPPAQGIEHYALNVPLYTHFTSPIRRYADIMVHRLLSASLKYRDPPNWEIKKVKSIANRCNTNKQNAKVAGEMSKEVYILKYVNMNAPLVMDAVVAEVKSSHVEVIIPEIAMCKRVYFNKDFPGTYKYVKNPKNFRLSRMEITWNKSEALPELLQTLKMFSHVKVQMDKGDELIKVNFSIIRPGT